MGSDGAAFIAGTMLAGSGGTARTTDRKHTFDRQVTKLHVFATRYVSCRCVQAAVIHIGGLCKEAPCS
jgi:hypothetical protein